MDHLIADDTSCLRGYINEHILLLLPIQSTYLIQAALEGIVTYKLMKLELPRPLIAVNLYYFD